MNQPDECPVCGRDDVALYFGPDPFAEEIRGDDTPGWQCGDCYQESALDI
jgi:hypothetical protein